jgi:hypothetical protein
MQQFCTYGPVRGAVSNGRPYRDKTSVIRAPPTPTTQSIYRESLDAGDRAS